MVIIMLTTEKSSVMQLIFNLAKLIPMEFIFSLTQHGTTVKRDEI